MGPCGDLWEFLEVQPLLRILFDLEPHAGEFSRFPAPLMSQCLLSLYAPIITHDNFPFLAVWVTFPVATRGSRGAGRLMGEEEEEE